MKTENIMPKSNLSIEEMVKQAEASLAIEDMYVDADMRTRVLSYMNGEKTEEDVLKELDEKYDR